MDYQIANNSPQNETSFYYVAGWFSALFIALMTLTIQWGTDSFKIIPIKAAVWSGMAGGPTYQEMLEICTARHKYECMVEAYQGLTRSYPNQYNNFMELGDLKRRLGLHSGALRAYDTYLSFGGADKARAHYGRAKSLASLGDHEGARQAFESALEAKPDVIQVTVTEAYLDFLVQNGAFEQAKAVIKEARTRGRSPTFFARQDEEISRKLATP